MSIIGSLLGLILLLFLIALVVRAVLDWTAVLASGGGPGVARAREISHRVTEPVIGPVRRVVPPVRIGDVRIDLAFTLVVVATVILRSLVSNL